MSFLTTTWCKVMVFMMILPGLEIKEIVRYQSCPFGGHDVRNTHFTPLIGIYCLKSCLNHFIPYWSSGLLIWQTFISIENKGCTIPKNTIYIKWAYFGRIRYRNYLFYNILHTKNLCKRNPHVTVNGHLPTQKVNLLSI